MLAIKNTYFKSFRKFFSILLAVLILAPVFAPGILAAEDDLWGESGLKIKIDEKGAKVDTGKTDQGTALNTVLVKYQGLISAVLGFAIATCMLFAIVNGVKLATSASQPQKHQQAKVAFAWTLAGTAILGSIGLIVRLAYRAIDKK